jgi:mannose-1-phosphate guanylyltransferase/mannose-1-phosphate guanylyltransferase/mannose-6-phosphate isomerase
MIPVILSGGSGTRLWPLSRALHPKQFIKLLDDASLFQGTLERLRGLSTGALAPIIVSNEAHRFIVAEQCRAIDVNPQAILLEPVGRNTAPAIAAAAIAATSKGDDPILLVLAADHAIKDIPAFEASIRAGQPAAEAGKLVTFGIVPTAAETGYGYIRVGEPTTTMKPIAVEAFVEKPNAKTAQEYVSGGRHLWNSGMFMFKASVILAELEKHCPAVLTAARAAFDAAKTDLDFIRLDSAQFAASPDDSIDYAVMEKTDKAMVVPMDAGWSDVGAWGSVWATLDRDESNNAIKGDVITANVTNSYIHAEHRLVAGLGLDNMVIVETSDAVMVAPMDRVQDVKKLVDQLKAKKRSEVTAHREVFRPWGSYDSIDNGGRYQVKRITVKPGQKLSVQMHHHRAEHWIVVSGTATVLLGDKEILLTENQSTYIPVGVVHALENPGKIPLELIEVQSGAYLGEDDIVRFEDRYGRA